MRAALIGSRFGILVLALGLSALGGTPTVGGVDHCLSRVKVTPVAGRPGWIRIEGANGAREVTCPPAAQDQGGGPVVTILALSSTWEADTNPATIRDTITVVPGTLVRWQWVTGFHTITDGTDSGNAGHLFDYELTEQCPVFDTTLVALGQLDYFCFVHEGFMHGVIRVAGPASVPDAPAGAAARFSRPPSPNPTRGTISCAVTLAEAAPLSVVVLDAAGREVATLHRGEQPAGEHAFLWNGRHTDGHLAPAGVYLMRMWVPGRQETRRFTLIR